MKCFSLLATLVFSAIAVRAQGDFIPAKQHSSSVVGIVAGQTAKLNVLYPSIPAPVLQVMCSIMLSILDDQGGVLKTQDFQLIGGKSASISLNADTDLAGAHTAQIHAITLTHPTSSAGYCQVLPSLDVVDNPTGKTLVHLETIVTYPLPLAVPARSGVR